MSSRYRVGSFSFRFAQTQAEVTACQRLRHLCFLGGHGVDADCFDTVFRHLMIEATDGKLVATARICVFDESADLGAGYTGQFYDVSALGPVRGNALELGRVCIHPVDNALVVQRALWAALTQVVLKRRIAVVFGCASLSGGDPERHHRTLNDLAASSLGTAAKRPRQKSPNAIQIAAIRAANVQAPTSHLIKAYRAMGVWFGDHVVSDPVFDSVHIFACLEVASVPASRARALRTLAQQAVLA